MKYASKHKKSSFNGGDSLKIPRIQNKNVPWLMNDVSVPFSIDIFESLTIEFGTEEIFP
jgi:hypothetical protein